MPGVVFVTAFNHFAMEAFEAQGHQMIAAVLSAP